MEKTLTPLALLGLSLGLCAAALPQQRLPVRDRGEVQHLGTSARVFASEARPLNQAVTALVQEYGWAVDYEDPPYSSKFEVVDKATPGWRAAHPTSKVGMIPAGTTFESEYPEKANTATSVAEEKLVLNKLVADYNRSGNPGKFAVREEGAGRFAVIGVSSLDDEGKEKKTAPILDTPLSLPRETRSALNTIALILDQLSTRTSIRAEIGGMPMNPRRPLVTVGGQEVPARTLLIDALAGYQRPLVWVFLYDTQTDTHTYVFSLSLAEPAPHSSAEEKKMRRLTTPQK